MEVGCVSSVWACFSCWVLLASSSFPMLLRGERLFRCDPAHLGRVKRAWHASFPRKVIHIGHPEGLRRCHASVVGKRASDDLDGGERRVAHHRQLGSIWLVVAPLSDEDRASRAGSRGVYGKTVPRRALRSTMRSDRRESSTLSVCACVRLSEFVRACVCAVLAGFGRPRTLRRPSCAKGR